MSLKVVRSSPDAYLPTRGSEKAAGLDLYTPRNVIVPARRRLIIPLDICIELPENTFGHVLPRSGLAVKQGIHVGAGVIDEDYRGNVGVLLFNLSDYDVEFKKGERIAQLVIKKYESVTVEEHADLSSTVRSGKGFGSSGL
jgi:dUTP pyrophosphatase